MLILMDPEDDPPEEWRVLIFDTGHFEQKTQPWYLWNPATPGVLERGEPDVPNVLFCSGHLMLSDGRAFVAGGQLWPAYHDGSEDFYDSLVQDLLDTGVIPEELALCATGVGPLWSFV